MDDATLPERRAEMVRRHLASRGITDPAVLDAMGRVPRERFVPREVAEFAYEAVSYTHLDVYKRQAMRMPTIATPNAVSLISDRAPSDVGS